MRKSSILSLIICLYNKVISLVTQSKTWHLFAACNHRFNRSVSNSSIVNLCSKTDKLDMHFAKRTKRIYDRIDQLVSKLLLPLRESLTNSVFISKINYVCSDFTNLPLILPGLILIIWGFFSLIIGYFAQNSISLLIGGIITVVGVSFVILRKSVSMLIDGSFVLTRLLSMLDIDLPKITTTNSYNYKSFVCIGIILGVLSCIFGTIPVTLTVLLFVVTIIGFYFTAFVAWTYVCILPFMPTMIMVAGGLALFVCIVIKKTLGYNSKMFNDSYAFNMFLLFMGIAFAISAVFSFARMSSIKIALVYIAFLLATYALVKLFSTKKLLAFVLNGISVFSIPVSLFGIYQHFTGFDQQNTWIDTEMFDEISGRVVSFFGNPNVFGEYLILVIITSLVCFFIMKNRYVKFIHLLAVALSGISLIYTYSRGCWIGVLFAVVIFLFISKRKVFAAFCVLGACSIFFLPDSIITRFTSVGNLADSSTSYRVYIWEGTIKMLKDFWVTGIGLGADAFNAIYPLYAYSAISAPHPHNLYLLILTETGILGTVAFLFIIVFYYKKLFSAIKNTNDNKIKIISSGLVAAMSGYLLQGMFDNVWYNYRVFLMFWIYIALGLVVDIVSRRQNYEKN